MPGFNIIGMLINAYVHRDDADLRRVAFLFGILDPSIKPYWYELGGVLFGLGPWQVKPHKWWHKAKHVYVEWTRLDANRSGKVALDIYVWLLVWGAYGWIWG